MALSIMFEPAAGEYLTQSHEKTLLLHVFVTIAATLNPLK